MEKNSKFKNRENECTKTEDGRTIWLSRSPAVCVTIIGCTDDACAALVVERGSKVTDSGKLCVPCGYMDWDENSCEAAERETWEETNFDVQHWFQTVPHWKSWEPDHPWIVNTCPEKDKLQNVSFYHGAVFQFDEFPDVSNVNAEEGEAERVFWMPIDDIDKYEWAFHHDERLKQFQVIAFT